MATKSNKARDSITGMPVENDGRTFAIEVDDFNMKKAVEDVAVGTSENDEIRIERDGSLLRLSLKVFEDGTSDRIPIGSMSAGIIGEITNGYLWWIPYGGLGDREGNALVLDSADRLFSNNPIPPQTPEEDDFHLAALLEPKDFRGFHALFDQNDEPIGMDALVYGIAYLRGMEAAYKEKSKQALSKQDAIKPKTRYVPNTKLANRLSEPLLYELEGVELDVSSESERRKGKSVIEAVSISLDEEGVSISKPMSQYDSDVHSAVATLYVAGNTCVTAAQICQTLTGSKKARATQIREVVESLEKQRRAFVNIDLVEEARGRELQFEGSPVTSLKISGYMLPVEKISIQTRNGKVVDGYRLLEAPILYRHASMLKQVVSYPQKILETGDAGSNTKRRTVIKNYLARRIGQISGKGRVSNRIKLATVYEKAEINPSDRNQRKDANDYVLKLLNQWQEVKVIKGYRQIKDGLRITAYDIEV